jgi:beta-glucosidase
MPSELGEPPKRLIGWSKVRLAPGEVREVTIQVDGSSSAHPFSYWDTASGDWQIAPGDYSVFLGNSSRSLVQVGTVHLDG